MPVGRGWGGSCWRWNRRSGSHRLSGGNRLSDTIYWWSSRLCGGLSLVPNVDLAMKWTMESTPGTVHPQLGFQRHRADRCSGPAVRRLIDEPVIRFECTAQIASSSLPARAKAVRWCRSSSVPWVRTRKDQHRPRTHRAQPLDYVPQDADRHVPEEREDQRPLRRLARVSHQCMAAQSDVLSSGRTRRGLTRPSSNQLRGQHLGSAFASSADVSQ